MDLDYQTIFRVLNKQKIDYLVVGGLAVNFHGVPRMTYDIDLMISLDDENIRIISIQDLIELKRRAGRKQDLSDVEHLKSILENS